MPARGRKHPDPFVDLFLRSDPEPQALLSVGHGLAESPSDKVRAILLLLEISSGLRPPQQHLQRVERAYNERTSVDLHILFLFTWFRALFFVEPDWPRMSLLCERMAALITPKTPPEIVSWASLAKGIVQMANGDVTAHLSSMGHLLDSIDPASPHHARLAFLGHLGHLLLGMGAADTLPDRLEQLGEVYEGRLESMRLVNCALTGDLDVDPDLSRLSGPPNARTFLAPSEAAVTRFTLQLLAADRGLSQTAPWASLTVPAELEPAWVKSARCLMHRQPAEALHWARVHANQPPASRRTIVGFDEYALVRAELASGNADAAYRLLRARRMRGSCHYIDDLFWARAEQQLGRKHLAARHLATLMAAARTYRADGRVNLEFRLACELDPTAMIELSRTAERYHTSLDSVETPSPSDAQQRRPQRGVNQLRHGSPQMRQVCDRVLHFARHNTPVLITGETGTGKELIARALHEEGPHASSSFVAINCAALSDTLIESELFGHERGAFTGAHATHKGLFREAGIGTVLLDEIGDISVQLQTSLLRVLETGEVRPVGSAQRHKARCRILAATNADLHQRVEKGLFRRDLLYRLERLQIHVPPLRDRREDIVMLASHFLDMDRPSGHGARMSQQLQAYLSAYDWPGNVRELRNVIERMRVISSDKLTYAVSDLDLVVDTRLRRKGTLASGGGAPGHDRGFDDPSAGSTHSAPSAIRAVTAPASAPSVPFQSITDSESTDRYLAGHAPRFRRVDELRKLFVRYGKLNVTEVAHILGISRFTAARDLMSLCTEGFVQKVTPTASRRSHFYRLSE